MKLLKETTRQMFELYAYYVRIILNLNKQEKTTFLYNNMTSIQIKN